MRIASQMPPKIPGRRTETGASRKKRAARDARISSVQLADDARRDDALQKQQEQERADRLEPVRQAQLAADAKALAASRAAAWRARNCSMK